VSVDAKVAVIIYRVGVVKILIFSLGLQEINSESPRERTIKKFLLFIDALVSKKIEPADCTGFDVDNSIV